MHHRDAEQWSPLVEISWLSGGITDVYGITCMDMRQKLHRPPALLQGPAQMHHAGRMHSEPTFRITQNCMRGAYIISSVTHHHRSKYTQTQVLKPAEERTLKSWMPASSSARS